MALAAGLLAAALALALDFRSRVLAGLAPEELSFDAASHALDGLDIYDFVRVGRPDLAVVAALRQSWWPPVHALMLLPSFALRGRTLAAAGLPSLVGFVLSPLVALLLSLRLLGTRGLWAAPVLGGLLIFSPMLVEMSGWIMFESICGCLALAAWWAYFGETRRQWRAACLLVTLIFLTKYHYGLFLGATFLAALLSEETARGRSALRAAVRDLAASRLAQTAAVLAAVLFIVRRILAHRSEGAPTWMPESNIFYGLLLLAALAAFWKRERLAALARELSPRLRDLLNFTILPSAAWLLLPGKVRGWYGQTFFDPPPEIARGFFENLQTFGRALAEDYTRSPWLALFLIGGVLLALGPPRGVDSRLRWLALFAIWPPLVIAASPLPAEARFLGFVAPALITAGTLGFLSWSSRLPAPLAAPAAIALAAAVLAAQVLPVLREGGGVYAARASYRYPNTPGEDAFIRRLLAAAPPDAPALVVTDDRHRLEPTIRLALRLRSPGISPRHVIVRRETVEEALARAAELPAPWVLVAPAGEADPEAIARAAGREALSLGRLGQIEEGEPEYVMLSLRARAP